MQYGVSLAAETVVSAADICPDEDKTFCIFGSGFGLAIRMGSRSRGRWYFGGAYEVSRHDPSNLLRLAILQQLRAETRYYLEQGMRLTPYGTAGFGATAYGNEFGVDTWGLTAFVGAGAEFQISRTTVAGGMLAYRPFLLRAWTEAGQRLADRYLGFGMAHVLALEFNFEIRQPLSRW